MDDLEIPSCPLCEGEGNVLGTLGSLVWFRCQDCGIDYNVVWYYPGSRRQRLCHILLR
jgi:predicted  nucleic acid-binding Zn ribbon protein